MGDGSSSDFLIGNINMSKLLTKQFILQKKNR